MGPVEKGRQADREWAKAEYCEDLGKTACCVCSKSRHFPSTEGRYVPVNHLGAGESTDLTATAGKLYNSYKWDEEKVPNTEPDTTAWALLMLVKQYPWLQHSCPVQVSSSVTTIPGKFNPYPTAFPYGNGMVLHFYQQQESSTTKTVHRVINKGLKAYV